MLGLATLHALQVKQLIVGRQVSASDNSGGAIESLFGQAYALPYDIDAEGSLQHSAAAGQCMETVLSLRLAAEAWKASRCNAATVM